MTPATGEGTSTATLSVSRLAIGSSTATASPGCLSHWLSVASVTDSPMAGTLISLAISVDPSGLLAVRIAGTGLVQPQCCVKDRKSTRLNSITNAHHVCRLLLAK